MNYPQHAPGCALGRPQRTHINFADPCTCGVTELLRNMSALSWQQLALARLGLVRDTMTPEDVRAVQEFIVASEDEP